MKPELSRRQEELLQEVLSDLSSEAPCAPAGLPATLRASVDAEGARRLPEPERTLALISAESAIVLRGRLLPALAIFIGAVFLAAGRVQGDFSLLLLTGMIPLVGTLAMTMLSGPGFDPAFELIRSTPARPGAVIFARTTLVLALVILYGLVASMALSFTGDAGMIALVTAWLGPTVILAALATLLAQYWRVFTVTSVILTAWTALVGLAWLELQEQVRFGSGLSIVLQPDARILVAQLLFGTALVAVAWWLSTGGALRRAVA